MKEIKYIHDISVHNMQSPKLIIEEILKYFSIKTAIDVGCGTGSFVKALQDNNIAAYGVDGSRVDKKKLFIEEKYFIERNLEHYQSFDEQYDIAICLEVVEHLSEESSEDIVKTLVRLSNYIVFSAAIPYQGGQNHINEQKPSYREAIFKKHGFVFYDVFRHSLWDNEDVFWWYKQNIFLVAKEGICIPDSLVEKPVRYIVHPDLYRKRVYENQQIIGGGKSFPFYLSLFLGKIKNVLGIEKHH